MMEREHNGLNPRTRDRKIRRKEVRDGRDGVRWDMVGKEHTKGRGSGLNLQL